MLRVIQGLPDLVLVALPISLPFSLVVAGGLYIEEVQRCHGFFWIQLAGRDPRRYQLGILGVALALSAGLWWHNSAVLPRMSYYSRYVLTLPENTVLSLSLQLAKRPNLFRGFVSDFQITEQGKMKDFSLVAWKHEPTILTAQEAIMHFIEDGNLLQLELHHGRIIKFDKQFSLQINFLFERLLIRLDPRRVFGPEKNDIVDLNFYTNRELDLLPQLARLRQKSGLLPDKGKRARLAGIDQAKAVRVQSALLPLLMMLVLVFFLGVHFQENPRRRIIAVIVACLALLLPQQIFLEMRAWQGQLPARWPCFLPTMEVLGAFCIFGLYSFYTGRKGRDRL